MRHVEITHGKYDLSYVIELDEYLMSRCATRPRRGRRGNKGRSEDGIMVVRYA